MRSRMALAVALAIIGLLATGGHAGAGNLDGKWIKGLFPGHFEAKVQGYRVLFAGYRNGGLKGEAYGQQDQGRWFVKGNALCVSWEQWTKGKTQCGSISQQGGWFVVSYDSGEMLKFRRAMVAQQ
jgi:hypothetical protein